MIAVCQAKDVTFEIAFAVGIVGVAWAAAFAFMWFIKGTMGWQEETTVVEERSPDGR